jgi:hypothetical protein
MHGVSSINLHRLFYNQNVAATNCAKLLSFNLAQQIIEEI